MDNLYYAVEERLDGWHVHPADGDDIDDDHTFTSRDDAIAWCRSEGVIPRYDVHEVGYDLDIGDPFV
ncbi:MAG: hypothetical protein H0X45_01495 [Planctomycetes bacterium]|nr:hypothetical protein [Planctomycetota bacterium]